MKVSQGLVNTARFGIKPGLARIAALLRLLGSPQKNLKIIHVAGTNGKGSVCAMLESCLRHAGYKTGMYTSPHLNDVRERVQVNGFPASSESFEKSLVLTLQAAKKAGKAQGGPLTYFEILTAVAFLEFKKAGCQIVILETGLGGRLDSTNVISKPLLTIITQVAMDHMQWLGDSLAAIAREKAGIIKRGVPLVTAAQGEALKAISLRYVQVQKSRKGMQSILPEHIHAKWGKRVKLRSGSAQELSFAMSGRRWSFLMPLLGKHQEANLACVLTALDHLEMQGWSCPHQARLQGIAAVQWPGRMQVISEKPLIVVDGAHNPDGALALARAFKKMAQGRVGLVLGMLEDKDWQGIARPLLPLADALFCAKPSDSRGLSADHLLGLASQKLSSIKKYSSITKAFKAARDWARPGDSLLCAGSLYTAGECLQLSKKASKR